jgi:hypothetical protein
MRYRFIEFEQNLFKKREGTQELAELEDFNKTLLPSATINHHELLQPFSSISPRSKQIQSAAAQ